MLNSYDANQPAGFAGLLDGIGPRVIDSYCAEDEIPFGSLVKLGTNPVEQVLKDTEGTNAIGVAISDVCYPNDKYVSGKMVNVLKQGRCWLKVSGTITAGKYAAPGTNGFTASDENKGKNISIKFVTGAINGLAIAEIIQIAATAKVTAS